MVRALTRPLDHREALDERCRNDPRGQSSRLINPALYRLARAHAPGIVDVTRGNNTVAFPTASGKTITVKGYAARRGYDLATGLGTIDAAKFVPELARAGQRAAVRSGAVK